MRWGRDGKEIFYIALDGMNDRTYRLAIAWQNVGYNQPPHPGFFLGQGMRSRPRPRVEVPKR